MIVRGAFVGESATIAGSPGRRDSAAMRYGSVRRANRRAARDGEFMKTRFAFLFALAALAAGHASAQVTFYEGEGFRGHAFLANQTIGDLSHFGFNNRASSAVVDH